MAGFEVVVVVVVVVLSSFEAWRNWKNGALNIESCFWPGAGPSFVFLNSLVEMKSLTFWKERPMLWRSLNPMIDVDDGVILAW